MVDVIEKPRRKASLKKQLQEALDDVAAEMGATVIHRAKVPKSRTAVGKKPKAAGEIVALPRARDQVEAFTPREMGIAADHLRQLVERIERLEEEKRALSADIKDVYAEAKGCGFNVKIIRKVVAIRRQDRVERKEEEAVLQLYLDALGIA